jgi:hypothetical protein
MPAGWGTDRGSGCSVPAGRGGGSAGREPPTCGEGANARGWKQRGGAAVGSPPGRDRAATTGAQAGMVGVPGAGISGEADAAVLVHEPLRRLAHGPAHDQEEPDDRDLQDDHQPDEGPGIHSTSDRTTGPPPGRYGFSISQRGGCGGELGELAQLAHAGGDLWSGEVLDALGAELFDVEGGQGGAVRHGLAQ